MVEIQLLDLLKTALNLDRRYTGYKMVYKIIYHLILDAVIKKMESYLEIRK